MLLSMFEIANSIAINTHGDAFHDTRHHTRNIDRYALDETPWNTGKVPSNPNYSSLL